MKMCKMHFYVKIVVILVTCFCMCLRVSNGRRPNIVFILTDDQDVEIGGMVSHRANDGCN